MASALMEASGRKAIICRKDKPNGDFVKALKAAFKEAKETAPSIIFLDDMDKFANGDSRRRDQEEYVTVQSCIDNIKGKDVFVLATANDIDVLPSSLLRAGRFDRVIEVCNPRGDDAVNIMAHYIKQKKCVGEIDAAVVARLLDGCSCAELETAINEAGLLAGYERADVITMDHVIKACLHTVHDIPNDVLNRGHLDVDIYDANEQVTRVIWHEAGHAAVAEVLDPGSVTLVSAYSGNKSSGGFTSQYNNGNNGIIEYRMADVCISLAGKAALEQKFGITDIGVSRDLEQAFRTVTMLIGGCCSGGFNLHLDRFENPDETEARVDPAAAVEIERLYRKTKEILAKNNDLLCGIAKALFEKSYLTAADIEKIKSNCRVVLVSL
ncbi:MAG: AAA family ATPase [Clostridia bacterium]|nr:AAA family ATPase [Clostridia bacterium]